MNYTCGKCRALKGSEDFPSRRDSPRGIRGTCRECLKENGVKERSTVRGSMRVRWGNMMARCHRETSHAFADYGGRGIIVYHEWHSCDKFIDDVLAILGAPRKNMTIDRIDNDRGYFPDNIRYATMSEQSLNKREYKNNTSGFPGVHRHKSGWQASVRRNGKSIYFGLFKSPQEAFASINKINNKELS